MAEQTIEEIELEYVSSSKDCQYSIIERKLATLYRNQEQILLAIKLLNKTFKQQEQ